MSASDAPARPASVAAVLGVAGALALLGLLAWVMATRTSGSVDAAGLLAQWFDVGELPAGLAVAQGEELARGDLVVRLEQASAPPEAERNPPPAEPKPGDTFDWSKVPVGERDTLPREVLVVRLPLTDAAKEIDALFKGGMELRGDFTSVLPQGGARILDRGRLPWGAFEAAYVVEREFEAGGTFRDRLRVNLSREKAPCVLIARWSRGLPASTKRVEELLAALRPRS